MCHVTLECGEFLLSSCQMKLEILERKQYRVTKGVVIGFYLKYFRFFCCQFEEHAEFLYIF